MTSQDDETPWVHLSVAEVMRMPAIGVCRVEVEPGGRSDHPRPWFVRSTDAWIIDLDRWVPGMVDGPAPPWSPTPLSELVKGAKPEHVATADLREAVATAAERVGVAIDRLPPGCEGSEPAEVIMCGLQGSDAALVAWADGMVVISADPVLLHLFRWAASDFSEAEAGQASRAREALRRVPADSGTRLIPHLHALAPSLDRMASDDRNKDRPGRQSP